MSKEFKVGDQVVYPSHGVGEIVGEEIQVFGDKELRVFIISMLKEKMTLRVPVRRAANVGLRLLCTVDIFKSAFETLQKKSKVSKGMWSKRAQEYELKINSGDVNSLAEVVRDLHHNASDPDRSYSERIIYESALHRFAGEFAVVNGISIDKAISIVTNSIYEKEYAA